MTNPLISKLEDLVRRNQTSAVGRELTVLAHKDLDRDLLLPIANLARRAGFAHESIRLLSPIVRSEKLLRVPPSQQELAEYAISLSEVGLSYEALEILKDLDTNSLPQVSLYSAFALFSHWDYNAAIPHLLRYVESPSLSDYQRLVGQVNLAAAYIIEHLETEADSLLTLLRKKTAEEGHALLHGNCLELSAQLEILRRNYDKAQAFLHEAARAFAGSSTIYEYFVRKWETVLDVLRPTGNSSALVNLQQIREEAVRRSHWESVRECDFYRALALNDEGLYLNTYFGTPYPSYRARMARIFKPSQAAPLTFDRVLHGVPGASGRVFDVTSGKELPDGPALRSGQLPHRLLSLLASDAYRPFPLGTVFGRLFSEENFNPDTSPGRVHQVVHRLRTWLNENELPLEISESDGKYKLVASAPYALRLSLQSAPDDVYESHFLELVKIWPDEPFSAKDARDKLGLSYSTMNRVLSKALEENRVIKMGNGNRTTYKIAG